MTDFWLLHQFPLRMILYDMKRPLIFLSTTCIFPKGIRVHVYSVEKSVWWHDVHVHPHVQCTWWWWNVLSLSSNIIYLSIKTVLDDVEMYSLSTLLPISSLSIYLSIKTTWWWWNVLSTLLAISSLSIYMYLSIKTVLDDGEMYSLSTLLPISSLSIYLSIETTWWWWNVLSTLLPISSLSIYLSIKTVLDDGEMYSLSTLLAISSLSIYLGIKTVWLCQYMNIPVSILYLVIVPLNGIHCVHHSNLTPSVYQSFLLVAEHLTTDAILV